VKLKTSESGQVELKDGRPVYVSDDGTELALDAAALYGQVRKLTNEARTKREALEAAEARLAAFAGIEDPETARQALEAVKSLDGKTKADIEKARAEVSKAWEAKLAEEAKRRQELEQALHKELIGGGVARSKFVAEKSALPADLLLAAVGNRLGVEGGQVVGKRADGSPIYSRENPSQLAGIDEILETLVVESPYKDHILKATQKSGSGPQPGANGSGGKRVMTRAQYDSMSQQDQASIDWTAVQMTD
jgi:hypothetical protein